MAPQTSSAARAAASIAGVTPYQLFMLTLCLWGLVILGAASFFPLDDSTRTILDYADNVVCVRLHSVA